MGSSSFAICFPFEFIPFTSSIHFEWGNNFDKTFLNRLKYITPLRKACYEIGRKGNSIPLETIIS